MQEIYETVRDYFANENFLRGGIGAMIMVSSFLTYKTYKVLDEVDRLEDKLKEMKK